MEQASEHFHTAKALDVEGKFVEAIESYNKSIELNPNYAVAYYNRRNTIKKIVENVHPAEDKEKTELNKPLSLSSSPTYFVISTIGCVSQDDFSSDSSDEEEDGTFSKEMFKLPLFKENPRPFTTTRPKYQRATKCNFDDISNLKEGVSILPHGNSVVITPLLQKLLENGFEKNDKDKLKYVSVSIGLNRMKSLSTRKNNLLVSELQNNVELGVRYEKFGFYWECEWYNTKKEKKVKYEEVRKFYKQLKKIDSKKAKKFREILEINVPVPYQELREYAKNHDKTKELVKRFRHETPDANVYLSLIDSDTVDFNGIYSAYLRIVANCSKIPTVMTTGYEFPIVDKNEGGEVYKFASQIDRMVRVKTTYHLPLGVYYPEPNTCILIPQESDTLPESFIYERKKRETACLLRNLQKNRKNTTFIFSEDNPLITSIPDRAKLNKSHKNPISFSYEFIQGASPTRKDIKSCKQVAQSHFHEKVWYDNLFINGAIGIKKCSLTECKTLLSKIFNPKKPTDRNESILELKEYMSHDVVDTIVEASLEVKQYVIKHRIDYVRSEKEEKLLNILQEYKIKLDKVSREQIVMLAQSNVLQFIEEKKINLYVLLSLDIKTLQSICIDKELMQMLKDKDINLLDEYIFMDYIDARKFHSNLSILYNYKQNPHYLKFMSSIQN